MGQPLTAKELKKARESLTFDQLAAFDAAYFDGRTCAQIAAHEGYTSGAVKKRLYRARQRAKRHGFVLPYVPRGSVTRPTHSLSAIENA